MAEKLTRPHWLVAEWIEDREKRRREALRSKEEWRIRNAPPPWSELDMRRHRLLDAIFRAVEKRGGSISKGDKGLARATIEGEKIDFLIREKSKQVKVPPDDKRRSYMTTDLVGTGKLVLAIRTYLRGAHNESGVRPMAGPLNCFWPVLSTGSSKEPKSSRHGTSNNKRIASDGPRKPPGVPRLSDRGPTTRRDGTSSLS